MAWYLACMWLVRFVIQITYLTHLTLICNFRHIYWLWHCAAFACCGMKWHVLNITSNLLYFLVYTIININIFFQATLSSVKCRGYLQSNVRNSSSRRGFSVCLTYGAIFEHDSTHIQWIVWPQRSAKGACNRSKKIAVNLFQWYWFPLALSDMILY